MLCRFFLTGFILASASASRILIENFDQPTLTWTQQNDPVMGGASVGTFAIKSGAGVFDGKVVDVPFLKAPGFIKVDARGNFPDVSSCSALVINAHASSNYTGYRVSFGTAHVPGGAYAYGYKAHFNDATGDLKTTCAQNKEYCPDADTLKDMRTLSLWGEGVAGDVHLEVKSIEATGCEAMVEELAPSARDIVIESFDKPSLTWTQKNDPVMGGQSTGTFSIKSGAGVFDGKVVDVP